MLSSGGLYYGLKGLLSGQAGVTVAGLHIRLQGRLWCSTAFLRGQGSNFEAASLA